MLISRLTASLWVYCEEVQGNPQHVQHTFVPSMSRAGSGETAEGKSLKDTHALFSAQIVDPGQSKPTATAEIRCGCYVSDLRQARKSPRSALLSEAPEASTMSERWCGFVLPLLANDSLQNK